MTPVVPLDAEKKAKVILLYVFNMINPAANLTFSVITLETAGI